MKKLLHQALSRLQEIFMEEDPLAVFDKIDADGSGTIDREDMLVAFGKAGVSKSFVNVLIKAANNKLTR